MSEKVNIDRKMGIKKYDYTPYFVIKFYSPSVFVSSDPTIYITVENMHEQLPELKCDNCGYRPQEHGDKLFTYAALNSEMNTLKQHQKLCGDCFQQKRIAVEL